MDQREISRRVALNPHPERLRGSGHDKTEKACAGADVGEAVLHSRRRQTVDQRPRCCLEINGPLLEGATRVEVVDLFGDEQCNGARITDQRQNVPDEMPRNLLAFCLVESGLHRAATADRAKFVSIVQDCFDRLRDPAVEPSEARQIARMHPMEKRSLRQVNVVKALQEAVADALVVSKVAAVRLVSRLAPR